MKAVGTCAQQVVDEVRHQFHERPGIMEGTQQPDYTRCVAIVAAASLKEMQKPGLLRSPSRSPSASSSASSASGRRSRSSGPPCSVAC